MGSGKRMHIEALTVRCPLMVEVRAVPGREADLCEAVPIVQRRSVAGRQENCGGEGSDALLEHSLLSASPVRSLVSTNPRMLAPKRGAPPLLGKHDLATCGSFDQLECEKSTPRLSRSE